MDLSLSSPESTRRRGLMGGFWSGCEEEMVEGLNEQRARLERLEVNSRWLREFFTLRSLLAPFLSKLFCVEAECLPETNQNAPHHPRSVPCSVLLDIVLGTVLGTVDVAHSGWFPDCKLRSTSTQNNFSLF
ncbi:hypothetical protein MA16_Dca000690 [Dendrobium catenatum]|uniref:Uncharacterized protein n=1 Tax=Dendrobium catenatum TaxID=906689 RepID=A0A2I0WUK2_9ASPA|nr:hypothetical protein MA16_Dca000690 [Dendrobium catenatum]